jgi:uncharacterized protein (DUF1501 family)
MNQPLHPECPDLLRLGPTGFEAALRVEAEAVKEEVKADRDTYADLAREEDAQQERRAVTRRRFFTGAAATATALATTQFVSTRASFAAETTSTLVHVFLYGGLDGLSLVAPMNDPVLTHLRPDFTLPLTTSIPLGRGFGLTAAFAPLLRYLNAGQLAFVPGVSDRRLGRSHFDATDICQLGGLAGETGGEGWLSNLVGRLGPGTAFRSVGVGSTLPRSLVGSANPLLLNRVASLKLNGDARYNDATLRAIRTLFTGIDHPVEQQVLAGLDALTTAVQLTKHAPAPATGVQYTGIGLPFKELATLIKSGANVRVATVGIGGWDTHENQGTRSGYLFSRLNELAAGLAAFFDDLGALRQNVTVLVSTEFGRRVAQNSSGTDHGHGSVVTILSGKKLAAPLLGAWNGLGMLSQGDVPEFNNLFNVYGSVAQGRFDLSAAETQAMFPRHSYAPLGVYA